jgi:hypothetical protein
MAVISRRLKSGAEPPAHPLLPDSPPPSSERWLEAVDRIVVSLGRDRGVTLVGQISYELMFFLAIKLVLMLYSLRKFNSNPSYLHTLVRPLTGLLAILKQHNLTESRLWQKCAQAQQRTRNGVVRRCSGSLT